MRPHDILYREEVLQDLQDAIFFYDNISNGLGRRFFEAFKSSVNILQNNPYYQVKYGTEIRTKKIFNFLIPSIFT